MAKFPSVSDNVHYMVDLQIFPKEVSPFLVRWINSSGIIETHSFVSIREAITFASSMFEHQYIMAFKKEEWRDILKQKFDE